MSVRWNEQRFSPGWTKQKCEYWYPVNPPHMDHHMWITLMDEGSEYEIRDFHDSKWLEPMAGPFDTLEAAKAAYLIIASVGA